MLVQGLASQPHLGRSRAVQPSSAGRSHHTNTCAFGTGEFDQHVEVRFSNGTTHDRRRKTTSQSISSPNEFSRAVNGLTDGAGQTFKLQLNAIFTMPKSTYRQNHLTSNSTDENRGVLQTPDTERASQFYGVSSMLQLNVVRTITGAGTTMITAPSLAAQDGKFNFRSITVPAMEGRINIARNCEFELRLKLPTTCELPTPDAERASQLYGVSPPNSKRD